MLDVAATSWAIARLVPVMLGVEVTRRDRVGQPLIQVLDRNLAHGLRQGDGHVDEMAKGLTLVTLLVRVRCRRGPHDRVKTEDEAIALANDSDFGLGGSVWTQDEARGKRVVSRVDTGMMFVNNIDWADTELPFGGLKNSGYGRELGNLGIQEFVNKKVVRTGHMAAPV